MSRVVFSISFQRIHQNSKTYGSKEMRLQREEERQREEKREKEHQILTKPTKDFHAHMNHLPYLRCHYKMGILKILRNREVSKRHVVK